MPKHEFPGAEVFEEIFVGRTLLELSDAGCPRSAQDLPWRGDVEPAAGGEDCFDLVTLAPRLHKFPPLVQRILELSVYQLMD